MKVNKIITCCIFLLLAFVSCSDESNGFIDSDKNNEIKEISFCPSQISELRSGNSYWDWYGGFRAGDRIGVFAMEKGWRENSNLGSDKAFIHNHCFYFDGQNFVPYMDKDRIFVRNEQLEFYIYYPYRPHMDYQRNMALIFSVSPFQNKDHHDDYPWRFEENNLMTAEYTSEISGNIIPLVFRHRLSLVEIEIYHGLDREVNEAVLCRKYIRNYFDLTDTDKRFIPDTTKYDINMFPSHSYNGVSSYMALVPEQSIRKDSLLFLLDISGKQYKHYSSKNNYLKANTGNYFKFSLPCTISLNETTGGSASGSGTYNCGDEVTVRASMDRGYNFMGWYENGQKVSDYQYYSFTANGDRWIEARFKPF